MNLPTSRVVNISSIQINKCAIYSSNPTDGTPKAHPESNTRLAISSAELLKQSDATEHKQLRSLMLNGLKGPLYRHSAP